MCVDFNMKILICIVLIKCLLCKFTNSSMHGFNNNATDYLLKHAEIVKRQINENIAQCNLYQTDAETEIAIKFHSLQHKIFPMRDKTINAFNLFNTSYIAMDVNLYNLKLFKNNSFSLHPYLEISNFNEKIGFLKVIEFGNIGLVLMTVPSGQSHLYAFIRNINDWIFVQSIHNTYKPIDGQFFINENQLYLILVNDAGDGATPSVIYKWMETHFDEHQTILTEGARSVLTFPDGNSEVLIILQSSSRQKVHSFVYEFKSDELRKIQILKIQSPLQILTYIFKDQRYFIAFNNEHINIYWWNGVEMILQNNDNLLKNDYAVVSYVNGTSILLTAIRNALLVYNLRGHNIELIYRIKFPVNYNQIRSVQLLVDGHKSFLFAMGYTQDNMIFATLIPVTIQFNGKTRELKQENELIQCLMAMESHLYGTQHEWNKIDSNSQKILKADQAHQFNGSVSVLGSVSIGQKSTINRQFSSTNEQYQLEEIKEHTDNVLIDINKVNEETKQLLNKNTKELNGKLMIKGRLFITNLKAHNINVNNLNGVKWIPDQWLLYSTPQTITGKASIKNLVTRDLHIPKEATIFDFLTKSGKQEMNPFDKFETITANHISTPIINNIEIEQIYLKSQPVPIKGLKTLQGLTLNSANIATINKKDAKLLRTNFKIGNLKFKKINGINWEDFRKSVFCIGISKNITGNIIFQNVAAQKLTAHTISRLSPNIFLTTTTFQVIHSNIEFINITARTITSNQINGHKIEENAFFNETSSNQIEGPVIFDNIHVLGNLYFKPSNNPDIETFLQIYSKVKIIGNLRVKNFIFPNISISDLPNNYWLKNVPQKIPVHFKVQRITTPDLKVTSLNNVPLSKYLLNDLGDQLPTNFIFKNAKVAGSVSSNDNTKSNIRKLNKQAVKVTGSYIIKGKKTFKSKLTTNKMFGSSLNDNNISELLTKGNLNYNTGKKIFETITVKSNLFANISTDNINGVNLKNLQEQTIFVDISQTVPNMNFDIISANSFYVSHVNSKPIDDLLNLPNFELLPFLQVNGNVNLNSAKVLKINNYIVDILFEKVLNRSNNMSIKGSLTFTEDVNFENLKVSFINSEDYKKLLPKLFYRNWDQSVTAQFNFEKINTVNLITSQINEKNVEHLISINSTESQKWISSGGIQFQNVHFMTSLNAELPCKINDLHIPTKYWNEMYVAGNITAMNDTSTLNYILEKSVTTLKNNTIKAAVNFTNNIVTKSVSTIKHINGINLEEIVEDALLIEADHQKITAPVIFTHLTASRATVFGNANIPVINRINIKALNDSIVHKKDINDVLITGHKIFFAGLKSQQLITENISDLNPEVLVQSTNQKLIPKSNFNKLVVNNNLFIKFVNNINASEIISNRILLFSSEPQVASGIYYFDILHLSGITKISSINSIKLNDVVFDSKVQHINSLKHFTDVTIIDADIKTDFINGYPLSEFHEKAVLHGENVTIEENIELTAVTNITANISTEYLNGISVEYLKELLHSKAQQTKAEVIYDTISKIQSIIQSDLKIIKNMPDEYLYLEKSVDLQISIPNTISAKAVLVNNHVMLYVTGEEMGYYCSLPQDCNCPVQHVVQLAPHQSINAISNVASERIYSYSNDEISIHVITNTVSSSSICRGNKTEITKEFTTIMWNESHGGETRIFPDKISGFLSAAEFFTINNYVYVVIGQFYNANLNSHNLDCLVIRISKNKAEIIQKIKTKSAWTLHAFKTVQGVMLIIGNLYDSAILHGGTDTQIFKFNETKQEFVLLRNVASTGCTSAVSAVLGTDSFIILAQRNAPLQILKYHMDYDNYYFYQSVLLESNVLGTSVFYTKEMGTSDVYLCIVTQSGSFYVYMFKYVQGWELQSQGELDNLQNLIPFNYNKETYLLAPSTKFSNLLVVVKHGFE